jgi:hypothetical protein
VTVNQWRAGPRMLVRRPMPLGSERRRPGTARPGRATLPPQVPGRVTTHEPGGGGRPRPGARPPIGGAGGVTDRAPERWP